ncbi:hypothetical protein QWY93_09030 [Echinicola jeungdonensis]|uniref:Glycosyl hydrolase family 65, N-terminal domain n=1 Tax=Echinicola jeungdonensis TaxID=709343 RepID=A0ABV5J9Y8_9BACT|nr:hypothetical protein [Echinicola jeungdonensis]MDN3669473.1 hypothetical protein [Echinicola jeungdonensis]
MNYHLRKTNLINFLLAMLPLLMLLDACQEPTMEETDKIDRKALVSRHNVVVEKPDTLASLSVGNGEFAYTVDVSGLQTFPKYYEKGVSLGTQSQWGWHAFPNPSDYKWEEILRYDTSAIGQVIPFPVQHKEGRKKEVTDYFRTSPHRLHLGIIGLKLIKEDGSEVAVNDLENIHQEQELWKGKITSEYEIEGHPVKVELYGHQEKDGFSAKISSPLISAGRLKVKFAFPYGSDCHVCPGYDWTKPEKHQSDLESINEQQIRINRTLDTTQYVTDVSWKGEGNFEETEKHYFTLSPGSDQESFEFTALFSEEGEQQVPDYEATAESSEKGWEDFWQSGGAIDFSECTDERAHELERRVVLSQYLTKVNCSGSLPPQETGLTMNSWYGKFHMEMHWWHAAHYALWGRVELMEKSLPWYFHVLEKAQATAERQGFEGARWQKMTDPYGDESPSSVASYLIWQQPHFLYFVEQIYNARPEKETLEKYKELVFETAEFMASFAKKSEEDGKYHLIAPLIPAQELFPANSTDDPPFELAYWHYGLKVALDWQKRLGMEENPKWREVLDNLAPLAIKDSLYLPSSTHPRAYEDDFYLHDHPIVLGAYGILPKTEMIDTTIMRNTLEKILKIWDWESTWGWDYPMMAMNAARLGMPETALEALFMGEKKNTYLPNGHNYQDERLRIYLPGNGGLLTTVAMMTAGWEGGSDRPNPGFPDNGKWNVKSEGLTKMP